MTMKVTRRSQIRGSRSLYNPTDVELVNILHRRIERGTRSSFITDIHNLYEKEPWLLQHVRHVEFYENEWFYFVTRQKQPRIKKADSNTPSRKVGGSGRWKATGALTPIKKENGVKIGSMKHISFIANSETKKRGITTGWGMHEFVLNKPGFQEVVLCRIRFNLRKDNTRYAPRLTPIMIGVEPEDGSTSVENNSEHHHGVAASGEELQYSDAPVDTHQARDMERWTGSCSGDVVSYSASQYQDSNYPMSNGGMEQYGQGFEDMVENQNQYLGQETTDPLHVPMMMNQAWNEEQQWNGYSGSSSAHQYLGQDRVPMTQCIMAHHQKQHLAAQRQHFSVNGSMEQYQYFGSSGWFFGESSGQQQNDISEQQATFLPLREQQCQNLFWRQETDPSHSAQAIEEQQQWNGYFGPYSAQPYDQGMMEYQEFGSSSLGLTQNHQYVEQNNDLSALGELAAQKQHLGEDSNLSLTQQQNQILGQATHLSPMGHQLYQNQVCGQHTDPLQVPILINQVLAEQHNVPYWTQPFDQSKGQNNELPTVPMETQQQQDNFVRNSAAQLQLEEQNNVPLINQAMEEHAMEEQAMEEQAMDLPMNQGVDELHGGIVGPPNVDELFEVEAFPVMDLEMADFGNAEWAQQLGVNTPEEEAELTAALAKCKTPESLINFFLSD